jgi:hypothetical protein
LLTYSICPYREPVNKELKLLTPHEILANHLTKSMFITGDRVVFKKPKRNQMYGVITHIEKELDNTRWSSFGSEPQNITVVLETGEIRYTSYKRIKLSGRK